MNLLIKGVRLLYSRLPGTFVKALRKYRYGVILEMKLYPENHWSARLRDLSCKDTDGGHYFVVNDLGFKIYVQRCDERAYWVGNPGHSPHQDFRVTLISLIVRDGGFAVFVDGGANYGEYSLGIVDDVRKVLFEPNPLIMSCLNSTFRHENRATIVRCALGGEKATRHIRVHPYYSGGSSFYYRPRDKYDIDDLLIETEVWDIGTMLDQLDIDKSVFIKLDIEGGEIDFLSGHLDRLDEISDWGIMMEFTPRAVSPEAVERFASEFQGRKAFELSDRTLGDSPEILPNERFLEYQQRVGEYWSDFKSRNVAQADVLIRNCYDDSIVSDLIIFNEKV